MKVVAFNGSPRKDGNTACSLNIVLAELDQEGIETELIQVGREEIHGCIACFTCAKKKNERCAFDDDPVNEWIQKMKSADGILIGSPVHFSGIAGRMKSFLDRAFFVFSVNGGMMRHKVGAAVAAVRRSGGVSTFDSLNHYLLYSEMVMPTANYWNVAYGMNPGEMQQDGEGKQIMSILGKNMAWLMKIMEAGRKSIAPPEPTIKTMTNFIR
ncbi:MAG: flavodoxin family protein [Desulfamplus sp.]